MAHRPVFVLVPGNFLPPAYYASTAKLLESHGYQTRLVAIPSTGSQSPLTSNEPDIVVVRAVLEELSESGKEIIVVAHSYGSIPTCEAAKGLGIQERLKLGKSGGLARLVFVAAWLLQEGEAPPDIIARYKMEAPWARFEVSFWASIPTFSTKAYIPGVDRVAMSMPTIPFLLSIATHPQKSQPTGAHTPLIPTSQLLQPRLNILRGAIFLPPTCCANWISVYCPMCRRAWLRLQKGR